jgi:hypothetical protein
MPCFRTNFVSAMPEVGWEVGRRNRLQPVPSAINLQKACTRVELFGIAIGTCYSRLNVPRWEYRLVSAQFTLFRSTFVQAS